MPCCYAVRDGDHTIRFDDGREVAIGSSALIGRNPAAAAGEEVDQLIDFADLDRSVSKTHLELRVDGGKVWVNDRNSTNGTAVTGSDGVRQQFTTAAEVGQAAYPFLPVRLLIKDRFDNLSRIGSVEVLAVLLVRPQGLLGRRA